LLRENNQLFFCDNNYEISYFKNGTREKQMRSFRKQVKENIILEFKRTKDLSIYAMLKLLDINLETIL